MFLRFLDFMWSLDYAYITEWLVPIFQQHFNHAPAKLQSAFIVFCFTMFAIFWIEGFVSSSVYTKREFHFETIFLTCALWCSSMWIMWYRGKVLFRADTWWRIHFAESPMNLRLGSLGTAQEVFTGAMSPNFSVSVIDGALSTYSYLLSLPTFMNMRPYVPYFLQMTSAAENHFFFPDWISFWLVVLTLLSTFICVVAAYERGRRLEYFNWALCWIGVCMILAFTTTNMLVFYCAFEGVLIPTFFLVGAFGAGSARIPAAMRLFLFTVAGSVLFLVALAIAYSYAGTFNFYELRAFCAINQNVQMVIFPLIFFGLAFKIPFFPIYLWLTAAHVEAPTAGSMILASLMLKLGVYGLLRFGFQICPLAVVHWSSISVVLPVLGFTYIAYLTYVINDLKRLVAYTSISHMNFLVISLVSTGGLGFGAAIYTMISHAIISSALFFLIGCLYRRGGSRSVLLFSGLAQTAPRLFFFFSLFLFANAGLPLFAGFPGEFFALLSLWHYDPVLLLIALPGFFFIVFGMVRAIAMGCGTAPVAVNGSGYIADLSASEAAVLALLMVWQVWLALCPYVVVNSVFVL